MALQRVARTVLAVLALLILATAVRAQAPAAAPPAAASTVELERLVSTLQDDAARKRLVDDLQALIAAQRRLAPPEETGPPVFETITARVLGLLSDQLTALSRAGRALSELVMDAPQMLGRIAEDLSDADERRRIGKIALALAAVLLVCAAAEWLVRRALRPAGVRLEAAGQRGGWVRLPVAVAAWMLGLLPLVAFGLVAYLILAWLGGDSAAGLTAAALVNAYLLARAVSLTSAALMAPAAPALRLLPIGDETAAYIHLWVRRFANLGIYGYFAAQALVYAGFPEAMRDFVLRVLGLVGALLLLTLILQSRAPVARWIAGDASDGTEAQRSVAAAAGRRLRRRLAGFWHVAAILYLAIATVVYLIRPGDGGSFVLEASALTALTWLGAVLAAHGLQFVIDAVFRVTDDVRQRFPSLQARANQYLKVLVAGGAAIVYGVALLITLHIWGARSLDWFGTPLGRRVVAGVAAVAFALAVALALWEAGNVMFERWVARPADGGVSVNRREARVRTLMPILQLALLIVLALFVGFVVLSELGVSIAPLLAGAGALGLAVGLGAQGMIKNLVTGVSMILTDTLAIGDVVTLGDKSGVVEAISISAVQLRSFEGTLHTIPFGSITVVSNQTKDYAYATFDVAVGYGENVDEAARIITDVGAALRAEASFAPLILSDLEVLGVDAFADRAMILKARIKTLPGKQWDVSRAFNRRLKLAFDAAGIVMPLARQAVMNLPPPVMKQQQHNPLPSGEGASEASG